MAHIYFKLYVQFTQHVCIKPKESSDLGWQCWSKAHATQTQFIECWWLFIQLLYTLQLGKLNSHTREAAFLRQQQLSLMRVTTVSNLLIFYYHLINSTVLDIWWLF